MNIPKLWVGIGLAVIATSISIFILLSKQNSEGVKKNSVIIFQEIGASDWILGNRDAPVTILIYADFSCLICATYAEFLRHAYTQGTGSVALVFRHSPVTIENKSADLGARAAEAAGVHGKFWEMADHLYERQQEWIDVKDPEKAFFSYAAQIGISQDAFKKTFFSNEMAQYLERAQEEAEKVNIKEVPTLFLNGKKILNPYTQEELMTQVGEELLRAAGR